MSTTDLTPQRYYFDTVYSLDSVSGLQGIKKAAPTAGGTFSVPKSSGVRTILNDIIIKPFERWDFYEFSIRMKMSSGGGSVSVAAVIYQVVDPEAAEIVLNRVYRSNFVTVTSTSFSDISFGSSTTRQYSIDNFNNATGEVQYFIGIEMNTNAWTDGSTVDFSHFTVSDRATDYDAPAGTATTINTSTNQVGTVAASTLYLSATAKVYDTLPGVTASSATANDSLGFTFNYTIPTSDRSIMADYGYFKSTDANNPIQPTINASSQTLDAATSGSITIPTGSANDMAFIIISTEGGTGPTISSASWTSMSNESNGLGKYVRIYWRRFTSTSGETLTVQNVATATNVVFMRISGISTSENPRFGLARSQDASTISPPPIYSKTNNSLSLIVGSISGLDGTMTAPSGYTIVRSQATSAGGGANTVAVASKTLGTGYEDPGNFGGTSGIYGTIAYSIVLEPVQNTGFTWTGLDENAVTKSFTVTPSGAVSGDKYWIYTRYYYNSAISPTPPNIIVTQSTSVTVSSVTTPTTSISLSSPSSTSVTINGTITNNGGRAVTRWKLERKIGAGGTYSTVGEYSVPSTGVTATTFTLTQTGLTENTTYYYRISASNTPSSPHTFGITSEASILTGLTKVAPDITSLTISEFLGSSGKPTSLNLSWVATQGNGTFNGYTISRGGTQLTTGYSGTSYSDSSIAFQTGTPYTYTVTAQATYADSTTLTDSISTTYTTSAGRYKVFNGSDWANSPAYYLRNHNDTANIEIYVYVPTANPPWQLVKND